MHSQHQPPVNAGLKSSSRWSWIRFGTNDLIQCGGRWPALAIESLDEATRHSNEVLEARVTPEQLRQLAIIAHNAERPVFHYDVLRDLSVAGAVARLLQQAESIPGSTFAGRTSETQEVAQHP